MQKVLRSGKPELIGAVCLKQRYFPGNARPDRIYFNEAMDSGVLAYVLKDSATLEIMKALREVAVGKHFVSSDISDPLVRRTEHAVNFVRSKPELESPTVSERKILRLISDKKTSREIPDLLFLSQY